MTVGVIGAGARAEARRRAVAAVPIVRGVRMLESVPEAMPAVGPGVVVVSPLESFLSEVEVVFVEAPAAAHFTVAEAATKRGVHVFLSWPPAASLPECEAIAGLAEEAGVEVGVSRPLRFMPIFSTLPPAWRASLILLRREVPPEAEAAWPRWLADAVDLCGALAQRGSVQRIDAEAVRTAGPWPDAVAFGLRFHSGTYAQASLRRGTAAGALYVGGAGFETEAVLPAENATPSEAYDPALVEAETHAFLDALATGGAAPVSILDGLHTLRLVERLMKKLR